jgi:hypothetical protein
MSPDRIFFHPPKPPGHRHRNRHVDTHHAHFDAPGELPRDAALTRKQRDTVPNSRALISFIGSARSATCTLRRGPVCGSP